MKVIRETALSTGLGLCVKLSVMVCVTLTLLFVAGWKTEREKTDTAFSFESSIKFERHTDRSTREGRAAPADADHADDDSDDSPRAPTSAEREDESSAPYVGGDYVSARSTMRYVIDDSGGRVEMFGYDVMRGRRVFVGKGRMRGRLLVIPNFYSFLDDTHGTLKLRLSDDERTFEGVFDGMNPAQRADVTLIRLP